jgi:hypothetical protein
MFLMDNERRAMRNIALSTKDNPFNPLLQFDEWYSYDVSMGYNSSGYLARICKTSIELSDQDQLDAIESAIDEIIEMNLTGNHIKVVEES